VPPDLKYLANVFHDTYFSLPNDQRDDYYQENKPLLIDFWKSLDLPATKEQAKELAKSLNLKSHEDDLIVGEVSDRLIEFTNEEWPFIPKPIFYEEDLQSPNAAFIFIWNRATVFEEG
jgi:hypothetical protein